MEIVADDANELFDKTYNELLKHPCDYKNICAEMLDAHLILTDPTRNLMNNSIRKMPVRYAIGELLWYNSRNAKSSAIRPFSKFWDNIADEYGYVNSNYGWCIHDKYSFDQWEFVKRTLEEDPYSRQAVIHIKEPRNLIESPTKDLNCTLTLQFFVRDERLHLIVNMRSNDIWLGLPYDLFNFTCMQIQMAMELNLKVGTYCHNAGSLHLYKKE